MKKENRKYIIVLGLCFVLLILIQVLAPKPISWKLSYTKKDKIPYGTAALYEMLPFLFPGHEISDRAVPVYNALDNITFDHKNYLFVNKNFEPDKLDVRELLNFVKNGNDVFIAANYFTGKFADTLKLKTASFFDDAGENIFHDSSAVMNLYGVKPTRINFTNPSLKSESDFVYMKGCENTYFSSFDTSRTVVLGTNSDQKINFISIKEGKGHIYINTVPEAFCNYNFANAANNEYVCRALSCLPKQDLIWDEYYKVANVSHESPMRVIFNNPALYTAYSLLIISVLVFMVLGVKRKQRIIPVIEPLSNTTLQFVDIVGTLYYQSGDHKNIASKKIMYFLEYIRSAFHIKTTAYDADFTERISNLSGIEKEKINTLFNYFTEITNKPKITQAELLKLNKLIEEFHTLNKR